MGSGQAVRRLPLEQEIEGSNPSSPANEKYLSLTRVFFICLVARVRNPRFGVRGAQVKSQVYLSFWRAPQGEGVSRHPSSPANQKYLSLSLVFFICLVARLRNPRFGVRGAQIKIIYLRSLSCRQQSSKKASLQFNLSFYYFLLITTFAAKSGAKPTDCGSPQ